MPMLREILAVEDWRLTAKLALGFIWCDARLSLQVWSVVQLLSLTFPQGGAEMLQDIDPAILKRVWKPKLELQHAKGASTAKGLIFVDTLVNAFFNPEIGQVGWRLLGNL